MTLVNKIIQVSGVPFYNTKSLYCIVCSPPQIMSPSITIYPPYTLFYLPPSPLSPISSLSFRYSSLNNPYNHCELVFKYMLLIMLLQLSQYFPLCPPPLSIPCPSSNLSLSSFPWVLHVSSLASSFPTLFLTPVYCLFCAYQLCFLFPVPFPPFSPSPLITFQVTSISVILFLF